MPKVDEQIPLFNPSIKTRKIKLYTISYVLQQHSFQMIIVSDPFLSENLSFPCEEFFLLQNFPLDLICMQTKFDSSTPNFHFGLENSVKRDDHVK